MKKSFFIIAAVALGLVSIAACGQKTVDSWVKSL